MRGCIALSSWCGAVFSCLWSPAMVLAQNPPGEKPALGDVQITQEQIESGQLLLEDIQRIGRMIFTIPFNKLDGYGDGPVNAHDPITPGGRPTLQGNGTFLRVNGLDAQTCLECHSIVSTATVPFQFGVGGVGGSNNNVIFQPTVIDMIDSKRVGKATFDGRFINPPFLFGSGGIELLAKEMTTDLQALKATAQQNPGVDVALDTKGVNFGVIRYENGEFDTSRVEGIDDDLVVRPFGRKGEFATVREFDVTALAFHFGMQPVEEVGENVDADQDGVANEVFIGEVSALSIFLSTLERPRMAQLSEDGRRGSELFETIGCADCHIPSLTTRTRFLTYSFPEEPTDPLANVFFSADLSNYSTNFEQTLFGGVTVPLFADLKRHDMGPALAESFGTPLDSQFTTARLWGVADTAPYLHDGRALTLTDAILQHGGEAQAARDAFDSLADNQKVQLLTFLRSLRTPRRGGTEMSDKLPQ